MHAEYLAVSGYNHVSLIVKAQTDDSDTRDDHLGLGVWCDFDYAPMPAAAGGDVDIPVTIKRQTLRPAKPRKESRDFAVGADPHHRIETRKGRSRDIKITVGPEAEVIGGHACSSVANGVPSPISFTRNIVPLRSPTNIRPSASNAMPVAMPRFRANSSASLKGVTR